LTRGVACEVVENGRGWWAVENVAYTMSRTLSLVTDPSPAKTGTGMSRVTFFLTRPHPRDSRTRDPARVQIPMSITRHVSQLWQN